MVVRGGYSVYCALRHGRHLGSGVNNRITLRCFRMAACIACCVLPMRSERVVALCVRSSDLNTHLRQYCMLALYQVMPVMSGRRSPSRASVVLALVLGASGVEVVRS